ncbi:ABC transporter permease [Weissella diestrammenae]|uniref:ABC transporter permease n=1 Tax=Weissella diestrammenae TaxID=1162633 RepID=A0A7G9T599_9LACO|nr:ABC transporter permease [Weissella diestrammenae]MCM0583131.1 ABC transporter permease [Weissella diestrammenae]QNN75274.1 ABC transporter permease [Weissella diestrammenae]
MRFLSITIRVLKELLRDKRTLALMFLAPLLVLTLMKVVFNTNSQVNVQIGAVNVEQTLIHQLNSGKGVHVKKYSDQSNAKKAINQEKIDAYMVNNKKKFTVTYANIDPSKTATIKNVLKSAMIMNQMNNLQAQLPAGQKNNNSANVSQTKVFKNIYLYGNAKTTYFDKILPILMGFFVFLFVFLISGMALLKERTTGTLTRLLATPVKRSEIVLGYLLSYGILAILQTLVIVTFTIFILNVEVAGALGLVMLINILLALVALSFGILMSTFAKSEFQMMQFIPIIVVPQIFFSGLISLDGMANWLQWFANILPMKYAGDALNQVIMTGQGLTNIWFDLLILLIFIVGLTFINIVGLKRYRRV